MPDPNWYEGREQTFIKHFVLEHYLQKLAYKLGWSGGTLNYVDCFAGPWKHASEELEDTSPFIAIGELCKARDNLRQMGRPPLNIRCLFIEKDRNAWSLLNEKLREVRDVEIQALNGEFEDHVDTILDFVGRNFTFFFIDPTGWAGYPLDVITPLLQHEPCEILINFMTQFIGRFVDEDGADYTEGFHRLFGTEGYRDQWSKLEGLDREDKIIQTYGERVKVAGRFKYVAHTIVLDPLSDRSHFHLIYATRHIDGLRVFRNDAERPATKEQTESRWQARQRQEYQKTGQLGLFSASVGQSYSDELLQRYQQRAHNRLMTIFREHRRVGFDRLEEEALLFPLMNTQSLKDWLVALEKRGLVRFEGLEPRGRVPQPGKGHYVTLVE